MSLEKKTTFQSSSRILVISDCDPSSCNDQNAHCVESISGSVCRCKPGFTDSDKSNPGKKCVSSKGLYSLQFDESHRLKTFVNKKVISAHYSSYL